MVSPFSSFDGLIPEIPGIAVDNFERLDKHTYFLSHCHTDHTQGLSNPALMRHLEDDGASIYMDDGTAAIIGAIPCYDGIKKYIKLMKLGHSTTVKLPACSEDLYLEVTSIPAFHCFGSVMFLFRTPYHTILFTGDFRISLNDVSKLGPLHSNGEPILIDKMYVDTTFINCDYEDFPKRSESVGSVLKVVKEWLEEDGNNAVALHPSARFGYEYVFNEIYARLGFKVFVQEADWAVYSKCQNKVPGVTNQLTRIHKCRNRSEKNHHLNSCNSTDTKNYLFVHLSAMKWTNYNSECIPLMNMSKERVDICFSTHCSRKELVNFVSYFSPKKVVGFPNPYEVESSNEIVKVVFKEKKRKMPACERKDVKLKRNGEIWMEGSLLM